MIADFSFFPPIARGRETLTSDVIFLPTASGMNTEFDLPDSLISVLTNLFEQCPTAASRR